MNKFITKLFCMFFVHEYVVINVNHYYDTSWGGEAPSTNVTLKCKHCGKLKVKNLYNAGFLTIEELNQ